MLELGIHTESSHKKIGDYIAQVADVLVTVGPRAHFVIDGALEVGMKKENIYSFNSSITAGRFLEGMIEPGDVILLKGSQGMRMERAVEIIMENKADAPHLLCRQEKEWKRKV